MHASAPFHPHLLLPLSAQPWLLLDPSPSWFFVILASAERPSQRLAVCCGGPTAPVEPNIPGTTGRVTTASRSPTLLDLPQQPLTLSRQQHQWRTPLYFIYVAALPEKGPEAFRFAAS